ncbi:MAG: HD domain-containing phosphohydrolase [Chloroflexota bacterium]
MKTSQLRKTLDQALVVQARNEFERQRGQVMAIFLLVSGVLHVFMLAVQVGCWVSSCAKSVFGNPLMGLLALTLITLLWLLNQRGHITAATHIVLTLIVGIITALAVRENTAPIFIAYSFPIIVASFLLSPTCSFLYASLAIIGYTITLVAIEPPITFDLTRVGFLFAIAGITFLLSSRLMQAIRAREKSEMEYRDLFERVPVGLYRTTSDGRILEANPALAEIFGYATPQEMLGVNAADLYAEPHGHTEWLGQFSDSGDQVNVETLFKRKDGSVFWGADITRVVYDTRGNPLYFEGSLVDISQRKQAEQTQKQAELVLRRQATQLTLLNDIAGQIAITRDVDGILSKVVELVQVNFGYHHVSVFLLDPGTGQLTMKARAGQFAELFPKEHCLELGKGMVGWCAQHGKTLLSNNVAADEHYINFYPDKIPTHSELCIPLRVGEKVVGVLDIQSPQLDTFDQNDIQVMETLADQVTVGLQNANLLSEIRQQVEHLNALHTIDRAIAASTNRRLALNTILEQAIRLLGADAGDFLLFNPVEYNLDFSMGIGFRAMGKPRPSVRVGEGLAGQAVLQRRTITIHRSLEEILPGECFTCYYGVPLVAKGQIKGIMEIFFRKHNVHTAKWESFLNTLGGQAAIALDNIELFERLQRSNIELSLAYNETIEGWSAALDLRDKETEGHTQRVTDMTLRLAASMGLPDTELLHIRRGALLHDIGKMGVPDHILLKPGKLSEEEWGKMRLHPVYAYELLSQIAYLKPALDIPYCHHEKWDGSGYPRGLKGEQIPPAARIFAVVDVWDALTSARPYRKAWSKRKALAHIRKLSGSHFDPKVVEIFLKMIEQV